MKATPEDIAKARRYIDSVEERVIFGFKIVLYVCIVIPLAIACCIICIPLWIIGTIARWLS